MGAVVELVITASGADDLGEAIGEQMICLNARHWDTSDDICERLLAWLRQEPVSEQSVQHIRMR